MAKTNNADYWARRMKAMEAALLDRSYDYVENLETQFTAAQSELERRITVWYQRLADNNAVTLADARRLLSQNELAEFHWTLGEYIAYGEQNALDGAWMKQLENASAKRHISRLEAMKLDIQQQAEVLYANQLDAVDAAARQAYEGSYWHTAFEVQRGLGVGTTMHAIDERRIEKVLSRPWTADGQTFRDRCWTNKQNLVNSVNTQLTQMLILGDPPDAAIKAIAKEFGVSRAKAGRLVMTESAFFASAAQKDCFDELGVEQYKIVAALDHETCSFCGDMDGRVFKMSEFEAGLTAPPFHPWCRCCTCPYFADMEGIGKRSARDAVTGESFEVPGDMTYAEWKAKQDARYGAGTVDKRRKMGYNETADKAQFARYQALLGNDAPKNFTAFQQLKYDDPDGYATLKIVYADRRLQKRIQSEPQWTTVLPGRQGKHILGHNNYTEGRSYLTISVEEVQKLVNQYAGTGDIKRDDSDKWTHMEFVTADKIIGYFVPYDGGEPVPTKRFSIRYATGKKKGAHIVPAKED